MFGLMQHLKLQYPVVTDIESDKEMMIKLNAFMPTLKNRILDIISGSSIKMNKSQSDDVFIYVNTRPINHSIDPLAKEIIRLVRSGCNIDFSKKFPFLWLHIQIPSELVDVNIEPEKTTVATSISGQIIEAYTMV